ncbi:LysR family transcriptional regulator [Paractinoplanes durhamensis]|uniref:LysR family transcriptional regulator n=1 Tax=Paractinoplanes durhamensis TaxID=113563 RepID=A0ABQ3Z0N4_9ACTN|nr:LysR family transcriptional regulator [Actinoplanes durhamensis]GIE03119.1 LysR family transcriptional regulator [Actinoplanes durhamensis]
MRLTGTSVDLNLAVALAALLEERNVTRAGERVNMSQPAMSAALARLRGHFGDELLHRTGRGYDLTPLGAELLPAVRQALAAAEVALGHRTDFDPATSSRHFTVALSDYAVTVLAEPLLGALAAVAPRVVVDLEPLPPAGSDLPSHLARCDLMVGPLGYGLPGRRTVVFRDHFVCIVAAGHPRLRDGRLTLADLGEMSHAALGSGGMDGTPADRLLTELGVRRHVEVTVQALLPLPVAVAGTDLCAFVPHRLAQRCRDQLGLAIAEVPFPPPELIEAAHWHPARADDPALTWLRDLIVSLRGTDARRSR